MYPMETNGIDGVAKASDLGALKAFLSAVEERTSHPVHLRLLEVAAGSDPGPSLERELGRIIQEIVDET